MFHKKFNRSAVKFIFDDFDKLILLLKMSQIFECLGITVDTIKKWHIDDCYFSFSELQKNFIELLYLRELKFPYRKDLQAHPAHGVLCKRT